MERRLYRSQSDRMVSGVCGGLAKYFDMDPVIVRIIFVLLLFANGLGLLAYIIMVIVVPLEGSKSAEPKDTVKENVEEMKKTAEEIKKTAEEFGREISSTFKGEDSPGAKDTTSRRRNLLGIGLIIIGALILMGTLNFFWWFRWGYLWPVIIIAVGLIIVITSKRKR
ncbi:PspC domain-containing protein [Chloroflexota bacterium]